MKRIKYIPEDVIEALTLYYYTKYKGKSNPEELYKYLTKKCNELGYYHDRQIEENNK